MKKMGLFQSSPANTSALAWTTASSPILGLNLQFLIFLTTPKRYDLVDRNQTSHGSQKSHIRKQSDWKFPFKKCTLDRVAVLPSPCWRAVRLHPGQTSCAHLRNTDFLNTLFPREQWALNGVKGLGTEHRPLAGRGQLWAPLPSASWPKLASP